MLSEVNQDIGSMQKQESARRSLFLALTVLFFVVVAILSHRKLLWNDEMYTLYFSKLQIWPDLWRALATGGDQLAPLSIVLTKFSLALLGQHHISIRLPETLGFYLLCVSLYFIVSKRLLPVYGFLAMTFPWITGAFDYSYEARPYALVLGFSALAFLCWQIYCSTSKKRFLACFGLSLIGAWMSHYSAILIVAPFVIGEAFRTRDRKKPDPLVWITLAISILPILLFLPLLQASAAYAPTFWGKAHWSDVPNFYKTLLASTAVPFLFGAVLATLFFAKDVNGKTPGDVQSTAQGVPRYELAAAAGFILLPLIGVTAAKITTGVFVDRYALPAVIGFSILLSHALATWTSRKVPAVLLVCFAIGFAVQSAGTYSKWTDDYNAMRQTKKFLRSSAQNEIPIVVTYSHIYFRLQHYSSADLVKRVYYLADPVASVRYVNHDTIDRGLVDLKPWWHLQNVTSFSSFVSNNSQFYVLHFSSDEDWKWDWLLSSLLAAHCKIELQARDGNQLLFAVSR